jgi:hypothetical protein
MQRCESGNNWWAVGRQDEFNGARRLFQRFEQCSRGDGVHALGREHHTFVLPLSA